MAYRFNPNYLDPELELKVVLSKVPSLDNKEGLEVAKKYDFCS